MKVWKQTLKEIEKKTIFHLLATPLIKYFKLIYFQGGGASVREVLADVQTCVFTDRRKRRPSHSLYQHSHREVRRGGKRGPVC